MDYLKQLLCEQEQVREQLQKRIQTVRVRGQAPFSEELQPVLPPMPESVFGGGTASFTEPQPAARLLAQLEELEVLTAALPRFGKPEASPASPPALPSYAVPAPAVFTPLTGEEIRSGADPEALSRFFERDARRYG